MRTSCEFKLRVRRGYRDGFTLPEVLVAATIMIIVAVGTLSVFSYVVRINRGENLRSQALSVMQREIEHFRSLKYVPVASGLTSTELNARARSQVTTYAPYISADGREFNIFVTITNIGGDGTESGTNLKEITIEAEPTVPEQDNWLQNLRTVVTFQRVRSN